MEQSGRSPASVISLFLGPASDIDRILDAIRKLRENTKELRQWQE